MDKGKRYRPNVAAIILSPSYPLECKVFIAQRHDISGAWQFPQGGIDEGESPKEALFRELEEEIGTNEIEILCEHPKWLENDFPKSIAKNHFKKGAYAKVLKYFKDEGFI